MTSTGCRVVVGAAQLGPIERDHARADVVERLLALLRERRGARLRSRRVPRAGADDVLPALVRRRRRRVRPVLRDRDAGAGDPAAVRRGEAARHRVLSRVRRAHRARCRRRPAPLQHPDPRRARRVASSPSTARCTCPGTRRTSPTGRSSTPSATTSSPGPDGFGVWRAFGGIVGMMICNDRRWPETYRVMGLQGVELILCGYNTPIHYVPDPSQDILQGFHNALVMQSGAYQNGTWVVGVAKGGVEEGVDSLRRRMIVAPSGPDRRPGVHGRRRAGGGDVRPRLVQALQGHAVRLRPLPPPRDVHPHHRPTRRRPPRLTPPERPRFPQASGCRSASEPG